MNTDPPPTATAAPASPQHQNFDVNLKNLCEKLRQDAVLTPPGIIDRLCDGKLFSEICKEAIYIEELEEFASLLNRSHLLTFKKCRGKI